MRRYSIRQYTASQPATLARGRNDRNLFAARNYLFPVWKRAAQHMQLSGVLMRGRTDGELFYDTDSGHSGGASVVLSSGRLTLALHCRQIDRKLSLSRRVQTRVIECQDCGETDRRTDAESASRIVRLARNALHS